jgi:hypothetical protein
MIRACLPELLDSLPPDHPDALHNRRDLRLISRIMRNGNWFERALPALMREGECALELGAGMGELGRSLNRAAIPVDGLDLWPRPEGWPAGRKWHCADLRSFEGIEGYPVVIGNLIFHQFNALELAALGRRLRKARVILACEPERRRRWQVAMRTLGPLFGANHVTLHDAHVSVTGGFRGDELPRALGLDAGGWRFSCESTALGAIRMVAIRTA